MLLEDEVIHAIGELMAAPEPGPQFADLLRCVWTWRVGDPKAALAACPAGDYPPLIRRDADMLRGASVGEAMPALAGAEKDVAAEPRAPDHHRRPARRGSARTTTSATMAGRCGAIHSR